MSKINPDLIITADWHLFEKTKNPPCRLDSIWEAQWNKLKQINEIQKKYKCPVYIGGDIFEHWKTSPQLINKTLEQIPDSCVCVAGNHDLPEHSMEEIERSGYQTLFAGGAINYESDIDPVWDTVFLNWGELKESDTVPDCGIIMAHMMVWEGKEPWPGCTDPNVDDVFEMFPKAKLIITGHNHKTIVKRKGDQLLINPGSLTRHKADQMDHRPCVFLWEQKTNEYEQIFLDINENVMSREHLEIKKEKDKLISAFIEKLENEWEISLSFEQNMEKAMNVNKTPKKQRQLILTWMER